MSKVKETPLGTSNEFMLTHLEPSVSVHEIMRLPEAEIAVKGLFISKSDRGRGALDSCKADVLARPLKQGHSREMFDEVRRNLEDELQKERIWNVHDLRRTLKLYIVMLFYGLRSRQPNKPFSTE